MNTQALVQAMTPQVYDKLREAVETGKWLDGSTLSEQQRQSSLQAVMMYQAKVLKSEQHMTVGENGEIVQLSRKELKQGPAEQQTIARFTQNEI